MADPVFIDICRIMCTRIARRLESRAPLRDELLGFAAAQATRPGGPAVRAGGRRARPR